MSQIPDRIGRYEVLSLLGQGGMGVLYLARDPVIDRHVALKLLKVDDADLRRRFVREARSAGRLQHPNIVTVYDVGDHDGELFIAMEYIDGDTLATLIREDAPFSELRKLEMIDQLADGLGFAHERGIVHRDIKPANLMVTRGGLLKVLDFGIARVNMADGVASIAGTILGTPAYMAPEQLEGADVDHRADIFAVGLVMYELLSGRRAFVGQTTADVLEQVLRSEPTPLEELVPRIDPDLARCVRRAIAKRPDQRYPDLASLRQDFARVRRRVELESGAFDATVVLQLPGTGRPLDRTTGSETVTGAAPVPTRPPLDPRGHDSVTDITEPQRSAATTDTDETVIAPLFASELPPPPPLPSASSSPPSSPPPVVAAPAPVGSAPVSVTGGAASKKDDGTAPPPARRSVLPALVVLGVVALMLAVGTFAALWWVQSRLFDRPPTVATTEQPVNEPTAADLPADLPSTATEVPIAPADRPSTESGDAVADPDVAVPDAPRPVVAQPPVSQRAEVRSPPASPSRQEAVRTDDPAPAKPPVPTAGEAAEVAKAPSPGGDVIAAREEAVALVRAYVAARNTGHAAGLRRVWPSASDGDIRRLTGDFSAPLTLSGCDVASSGGDRMRATCRFTQPGSTAFSEGTALTIRRQLTFEMERQGRTLVITEVTE